MDPNSQDLTNKPPETSHNVFCFIIYNSKELNDFKKSVPKNLSEVPEYIAIKFGLIEKLSKKTDIRDEKSRSFIQICYFSKDKDSKFANKEMGENNQEKILYEQVFDSEKLNFADEEIFSIKILYDNDNLEVMFADPGLQHLEKTQMELEHNENEGKQQNSYNIKIPLKISKLLSLEMGKGHVGFLQDSKNGIYGVDFINWKMVFNII